MQELHATQKEVRVDGGGVEGQEKEGSECGGRARGEDEEGEDGGRVGDVRRAVQGAARADGRVGG